MEEHLAKDKILEIILTDIERPFGLLRLQKNGLNAEINDIRLLLKRIERFEYNVAEISTRPDGEFIIANDETKPFLDSGGFTGIHNRQKKENEAKLEIEKIENDKLRLDHKLSKWQVKTRWWPLFFSAISLIISIIALVVSINKD